MWQTETDGTLIKSIEVGSHSNNQAEVRFSFIGLTVVMLFAFREEDYVAQTFSADTVAAVEFLWSIYHTDHSDDQYVKVKSLYINVSSTLRPQEDKYFQFESKIRRTVDLEITHWFCICSSEYIFSC